MPHIHPPKRLVSCELIALAARHPADFVECCEDAYHRRIQAAVQNIIEHDSKLVMLTGASGAGKTTSANKLAQELRRRGKTGVVISLDDFFLGEGLYPKRPDGEDDYECVEALNLPLLRQCLRQLLETGECEAPEFDFLTQLPKPQTQHIDSRGGVAIVEGLHAFNPKLTSELPTEHLYYIYASLMEEYTAPNGNLGIDTREVRLMRRMTRDWLFRGHDAAFTLGLWPHVCESEDKNIKAFKHRADLVLDTSFSYEVCLWEHFAERICKAMPGPEIENLRRQFADFSSISSSFVPQNSMLREFIGAKNDD